MTICPLDGESDEYKTLVPATEQGEEKHVTEGKSIMICPLDGEAEEHKTSVLALEQV